MSPAQLLLLPAFFHVGFVLVLVSRIGLGRVRAARKGQVRMEEVALDSSKWPDDLRKLANNYENQFEIPVLYYAALALLLITGLVDGAAIVLSWAFVATRIVHSFIHTGENVVFRRFLAFVAGVACLALLWAWFGLRLFVIG